MAACALLPFQKAMKAEKRMKAAGRKVMKGMEAVQKKAMKDNGKEEWLQKSHQRPLVKAKESPKEAMKSRAMKVAEKTTMKVTKTTMKVTKVKAMKAMKG